MSEHLKDLEGVLCLKNDVLPYGKTESDHDDQLDKVLQLCKIRVLVLLNPTSHTVISADASSYGLGTVYLWQKPQEELEPVTYISCSMTITEKQYTQIEKDLGHLSGNVRDFPIISQALNFIYTEH